MKWIKEVKFSQWLVLSFCVFVNWFTVYFLLSVIEVKSADLWALGVVAVVIAIAISPIAENIARMMHGARQLTSKEKEVVESAYNRVVNLAQSKGDFIDGVPRYFMVNDKFPNAFAIGSKTVLLTTGLLQVASKDELAAIIAHEFGHLKHGDSKILLISNLLNLIGSIGAKIGTVFVVIFGIIAAIDDDGMNPFIFIPILIFTWVLRFMLWLLQKAIDLGMLSVGRSAEYRADNYAKTLGLDSGMISFIEKVAPLDSNVSGWVASLHRSHPQPEQRIIRLEQAE